MTIQEKTCFLLVTATLETCGLQSGLRPHKQFHMSWLKVLTFFLNLGQKLHCWTKKKMSIMYSQGYQKINRACASKSKLAAKKCFCEGFY